MADAPGAYLTENMRHGHAAGNNNPDEVKAEVEEKFVGRVSIREKLEQMKAQVKEVKSNDPKKEKDKGLEV